MVAYMPSGGSIYAPPANWAWDYFLYERAVRLILPTASERSESNSPGLRRRPPEGPHP